MSKSTWRRKLALIVAVGSLAFLINFLMVLGLSYYSLKLLKKQDFYQAKKTTELALKLLTPLKLVTLNQSQLVLAAEAGLTLENQLSQSLPDLVNQKDLTQLDLSLFINQLPNWLDQLNLTLPILKRLNHQALLPLKETALFLVENKTELKKIAHELATRKQTWLVIFQNTNELRATGGFMGSYALVTIDQGKLSEIRVEDIYDADGQFQGYVEPPVGVKEYLSANRGLRLPDSNWYADFPTSAQQVLAYFALGDKTQIQGVFFLNNNLAKKLLKFTGPIFISDYQKLITPSNFDRQLQERGRFFPGSQTKKHLLSLVLNQLTLKLPQAIKSQPEQFINLLKDALVEKDLQAFSIDSSWQKLFDKLKLTNRLTDHSQCLDLALIESNVGINKVNAYVSREVQLELSDQPKPQLTIKLFFNNRAKAAEKGKNEYVNYQRVLTDSTWQVQEVRVNNKPPTKIDKEQVSYNDSLFQQLGFLVVTKPESKTTAVIRLTEGEFEPRLCLFKQPGLPATSYTIKSNLNNQKKIKVLNLKKDEVINFSLTSELDKQSFPLLY